MDYSKIKFISSCQFTLKVADHTEISNIISKFINEEIKSKLKSYNFGYRYFIGGLGSFGSSDMNFNSDIDMIIVIENESELSRAQKDFGEILIQWRKSLEPLVIDFRLRPEGKSSQLIWDLENYTKYFDKRA
ncbi:hypothetical protein ACFLS9_10945, partial [Bacteroidota bacterium]